MMMPNKNMFRWSLPLNMFNLLLVFFWQSNERRCFFLPQSTEQSELDAIKVISMFRNPFYFSENQSKCRRSLMRTYKVEEATIKHQEGAITKRWGFWRLLTSIIVCMNIERTYNIGNWGNIRSWWRCYCNLWTITRGCLRSALWILFRVLYLLYVVLIPPPSLNNNNIGNLFEYPAKSKNQCVIVVMLFLEVVVEKLWALLSKHECIQISGTALADVLALSNLSLCKKH